MKKVDLKPEQVNADKEYFEKLKLLRMKHGHVQCIQVEIFNDDGEPELVEAWFKRPSLQVLDAVSAIKNDELSEPVNLIFSECWLEGDKRIKERDYAKLDAFRSLNKFLKSSVATVKKPFALGL